MDTNTMTRADYALAQMKRDLQDRAASLARRMDNLSHDLKREADKLRRDGYSANINTLGVCQFQGLEIDRLCGELDAARKAYALAEIALAPQNEQSLVQAAQDIVEGWDGTSTGGEVRVPVEDIKALRDGLLARDSKEDR